MRKIQMPEAGKSPSLLTLARWYKGVGQSVCKGDLLARAESSEGLVDLLAAEGGVLSAILVEQGKSAAPGTVIAEMADAMPQAPKVERKQEEPMATNPTPAIPILMPQAGNSMEEGTIVKWLVAEGERVKTGQVLFEIETDKANMEVEATEDGRIAKIVAAEGTTVPVKQPVAYMGEGEVAGEMQNAECRMQKEEEASDQATERRSDEGGVCAAAVARAAVVDEGGRVKASPAARKLAVEKGVNLTSVGAGSGPGGRILTSDLAGAMASARSSGGSCVTQASSAATPSIPKPAVPAQDSAARAATTYAPAAPAAAVAPPLPAKAPLPATPASVPVTGTGGVRKKMSKMRKAIAANLSLSKQTIPHFYLRGTINADAMMAFYKAEKTKYPCSVNDVVVLALAKAMMEFPAFRSKIDGDEIVEFPNANVGIAVSVEDGLTVPVLLDANNMTLQQIGANSKRIAENARAGKLEGWGEGNFTITNLGMFGVEEFAAIVNPPEPGILAVGAVREGVIVKDGFMKPGKLITMTLSCDHRVIDGLLAAKFMARLKELLESPALLG